MDGIGEGRDTPGSELIARRLLDDDPRPVWIQAWGGTNTIAQALYRIRTSWPEKLDDAVSRACIYAIAVQEKADTGPWIRREFPGVRFILNHYQFWRNLSYAGDRFNPIADHPIYSREWLRTNIKENHGPLGPLYDMDYQSEGDSFAFFHNIDTGLRSLESPWFGGWGGRFEEVEPNYWIDAYDDGDRAKAGWRWLPTMADDFAGRMDWCVDNSRDNTNHPPVVRMHTPLDMTATPGETVELSAQGTSDPDGDTLCLRWWHYHDVSSPDVRVQINKNGAYTAQVMIERANPGDTIHIVLEVTDSGTPPMTRYARTILHVRDEPKA